MWHFAIIWVIVLWLLITCHMIGIGAFSRMGQDVNKWWGKEGILLNVAWEASDSRDEKCEARCFKGFIWNCD